MESERERDSLIERRHTSLQESDCWDRLTLSQRFSANCLAKYGYQLAFVRTSESGSLAILTNHNQSTTISDDGNINTTPNIKIRL